MPFRSSEIRSLKEVELTDRMAVAVSLSAVSYRSPTTKYLQKKGHMKTQYKRMSVHPELRHFQARNVVALCGRNYWFLNVKGPHLFL